MNSDLTPRARSIRWAQTYAEFDGLLQRLENAVWRADSGALGYPSEAFKRRVMQVLSETLLSPYLRESAKLFESGDKRFPASESPFNAGPFILGTDGAWISPGLLLRARSLGRFLLQWSFVLGAVLFQNRSHKDKESATLLLGFPEVSTVPPKTGEFMAFCDQSRISPLQKMGLLLIQAESHSNEREDVGPIFCKRPLLVCARQFGWKTKARFALTHVRALAAYVKLMRRAPLVCLLGHDFAYHALVQTLNDRSLIRNIVLTNSNYACQYLWMADLPDRHFQTHMAWYSVNASLFSFRHYSTTSIFPPYRYMKLDHHWVWTEGHAQILRQLHPEAQAHAIGPILFYTASDASHAAKSGAFRIGLFDVTPTTSEWARSFGLVYNYYQTETMIKLVNDVVALANRLRAERGIPCVVLLKHKRTPKPMHDPRYLDRISHLEQKKQLQVVDPEINLFSFVSECDAVVVIPYSSPAYVAAGQGTRALYYDPTGMLKPTFDADPKIQFAGTLAELETWMIDRVAHKSNPVSEIKRCAS